MALAKSSEAKEMQAKVEELNQMIDASMEELAHITDVLEETITISDLIADSSDYNITIRVAAANEKLLKVVEKAADIARLLIYAKEKIKKL